MKCLWPGHLQAFTLVIYYDNLKIPDCNYFQPLYALFEDQHQACLKLFHS
jgi:hypothetical protein